MPRMHEFAEMDRSRVLVVKLEIWTTKIKAREQMCFLKCRTYQPSATLHVHLGANLRAR